MSESKDLAEAIIGTWELIDRIDRAADGSTRDEPNLGSDPVAQLTYTKTRFAAQFMRRDRRAVMPEPPAAGGNNTTAVGGYDAYFGTYSVGEDGAVLHRLLAALTPDNVGMEVSRFLTADKDRLTIRLPTATAQGEPVTRTLTWRRLA